MKTLKLSLLVCMLMAMLSVGKIYAQEIIIRPEAPREVTVRPVRPSPRHYWHEGEWVWRRGGYVWAPGFWEVAPRGGVWIPGHWKQTRRGWIWIGGHWR